MVGLTLANGAGVGQPFWEEGPNRALLHAMGKHGDQALHAESGDTIGQPITLVCSPAGNNASDLVAAVAGYLAERRAFPQERSVALAGAQEDLALVVAIVKECPSVENQLKILMLRAGRILRANWSVVQQLAGALSKTRRRLEGAPLQRDPRRGLLATSPMKSATKQSQP